jgi:predicted DNA-binding transcriptional regulator AlpA
MRRTIPTPNINPTGRVLNFEQARTYLRYSKSHMYKLTSAGVLPYSKPVPNGRLYFDRHKLDEWLLGNASISDHERDIAASTYTSTH